MKYFTLAALAVVGIAAMPRPESEIWGNFDDYEGLNEDCYDDEVGQVQSGYDGGDILIGNSYDSNEECDDGPIDEIELVDVNIQPQYPDVDLKIPLVDDYVDVDEDCVDEIVTESPVEQILTTEPEEPPCYDENGDLIDMDQDLDYGNEYNDLDNIIENAEHGFSDLDLIISKSGDIQVQSEGEGYDGCLEDY